MLALFGHVLCAASLAAFADARADSSRVFGRFAERLSFCEPASVRGRALVCWGTIFTLSFGVCVSCGSAVAPVALCGQSVPFAISFSVVHILLSEYPCS